MLVNHAYLNIYLRYPHKNIIISSIIYFHFDFCFFYACMMSYLLPIIIYKSSFALFGQALYLDPDPKING